MAKSLSNIIRSGSTGAPLPVPFGGTGAVTLTGLVKGTGTAGLTAAVAGTDYQAPIGTISGIAKGNGTNLLTVATPGTDYVVPSGSITGTAGGLSSTLAVTSGGTGVTTSTGSGNNVLSTSPSLTTPVLTSYSSIQALLETATVSTSAPSSTTNFDVITQAVQYYTSNTTTNFTLNFRGNDSTALNAIMSIGQSATIALIVTNSTTAYYPSTVQIDGTNQTVKWQNGTAISSGNASALDVYTFTAIKTAANTYTVLGSQTKFA